MSHKELDVSNSSVPAFHSKNIVLTDVLFPLDYLCNRGAISMLAVTSGVQLLPSFDGPQFYPLTLVMTQSTLCSISALQTPTSSSFFSVCFPQKHPVFQILLLYHLSRIREEETEVYCKLFYLISASLWRLIAPRIQQAVF